MTDLAADPRSLNAPDLVAFAKALLAKQDRRSHWTVAAITLGRIVDERIYERTEFGAALSEEAWAKDKLGLTRGEVRLALKLWRAMERHPEVPWASLSKPKALLLDEVLAAGADVLDWTARARNATSTTAFEREVRSRLGDASEIFHALRIQYPESMAELVEAAFSRAARAILSDDHSPEGVVDPQDGNVAQTVTEARAGASWRNPAVAFRALEVILAEYLAGLVRA